MKLLLKLFYLDLYDQKCEDAFPQLDGVFLVCSSELPRLPPDPNILTTDRTADNGMIKGIT